MACEFYRDSFARASFFILALITPWAKQIIPVKKNHECRRYNREPEILLDSHTRYLSSF